MQAEGEEGEDWADHDEKDITGCDAVTHDEEAINERDGSECYRNKCANISSALEPFHRRNEDGEENHEWDNGCDGMTEE